MTTRWARYVALGDSFTEGLVDPVERPEPAEPVGVPGDRHRGWADRLAQRLDADRRAVGAAPLEYANLAVRGRLLRRIVDEQVPAALAARPDLVSIVGGGNDVLRPGADPDALATLLESAVSEVRATGADVLLATGMDPRDSPLIRRTRGRSAIYNANIWSLAQRHGAFVLDLWGTHALRDWRLWAPDRIHLSSAGHARVADLAAATLGLADDGAWAVPLPPAPALGWRRTAAQEAVWVRTYVAPWVRRRLAGRSSGDGRAAKRPVALPLD